MKRFAVGCALALAAIFLASGCNDYGNTFQGNTGASLISISPSIVNAGAANPITLTMFGGGFVAGTKVQWNGGKLVTTATLDGNRKVTTVIRRVPASLGAKPRTAPTYRITAHSAT